MKTVLHGVKKFWVFFVLLVLATGCAGKEPRGDHRPHGHHGGPPPEAIEACKGHSEGDKVTFNTPRGDEVTGICKKFPEHLMAVPEGAPPGKFRKDTPPGKGF